MCAPVLRSVAVLAQGLTVRPPAARVVSCTPLPGGMATCGIGVLLCLRVAAYWRVGTHRPGSPLGRSAVLFPRVAQHCNIVAGCPTYEMGPHWRLDIASGVLGVTVRVIPESGMPGLCLAPVHVLSWKKG